MPSEWNRVYGELSRAHRSAGGRARGGAPIPLILNGWVGSSASEKHLRWLETVEWARAHGLHDVVDSVSPGQFATWDHDELPWYPTLEDETEEE